MKFFSTVLTATFVVLLGVVGTMAQTSDQVISAIQSFITASRSLDTAVSGLNAINFPTQGFIIASGFNNITSGVRLAGGAPEEMVRDADMMAPEEYDQQILEAMSEGSTLPPEYQQYPATGAGAGR